MSEPLLDEQVKASDTASDFLASSELKEKQIEQEAEVTNIESSGFAAQQPQLDKISEWKKEQSERIAKKDKEEELKKSEWKATAKKELEEWYKQREETLVKIHASHKAVEEQNIAESKTPGKEWERLANMCDFNPRTNKSSKDLGRMRGLLLLMKQQPLVR